MATVKGGGGGVRPGDLVAGAGGGVVVAPQARATEVPQAAQEIGAREFEPARLMIAEKSLRKAPARYGRD
jgi:regulator of RNase E activity RraA